MPHSVPHMVQLRKFIVSDDSVFLLLQYAEGVFFFFILFASTCFLLSCLAPCALVPDRCLIEMGVCHRSLF